MTPFGEHELATGSLVIGRSPDSNVMIDDALVSRIHARVAVGEEGVTLEDLHSSNGVYVNGFRISHRTLLHEGDRILIGTTELSVFESRSSAQLAAIDRHSPSTVPSPSSDPERKGRTQPAAAGVARASSSQPLAARSTPTVLMNQQGEVAPTARADALRIVGSLANRLATSGKVEEATRVLSSHLKRILQGANAGLAVPDDLCEVATQHALDLARWAQQATWVDYVIELHLSTRRVMSHHAILSFETAARALGDSDPLLLEYYVESLKGRAETMSRDERARLALLLKLTGR
jgi:predicted component of type VI protein secretion system